MNETIQKIIDLLKGLSAQEALNTMDIVRSEILFQAKL